MATSGSGSTLTNLAQKRRSIDKTRQALRLNPTSDIGGGVNSRVRPPAPPPPPKTNDAAEQAGAPQPEGAVQRDPALLKIAQDHLDEIRNQGNPRSPAPPPFATAPPTAPATLPDQIAAVGAANLSPEQAFMRLNGRPPAPREMVIYNATSQLTQQLGRAPTRNEVLMYVTRGADVNSGPEPAVM